MIAVSISTTNLVILLTLFPWTLFFMLFYYCWRATAVKKEKSKKHGNNTKKTSIGNGKFSKWGNKGGGPSGSTTSKEYRKKPRGQG